MAYKYGIISYGNKKNKIRIIHLKKPNKNGFAGMVVSSLLSKKVALMVKDDCCDSDFHLGALGISTKDDIPVMYLERETFFDFKRGIAYSRVIVLHELGHYYNGDLIDLDFDEYQESRVDAAKKNRVLEAELKADAFAVSYVGKDTVVEGLSQIKEILLKGTLDVEHTLAVAEIDNRIKHIIKG